MISNLHEDILPFLCTVLDFPVAEITTFKGTLFSNCGHSTQYYHQQSTAQKRACLFLSIVLVDKQSSLMLELCPITLRNFLRSELYAITGNKHVRQQSHYLNVIAIKYIWFDSTEYGKDHNHNLPHPSSSESSPSGHSTTKLQRLVNGKHVPSLHLCSIEVQFLLGLPVSLKGKKIH